MKVTQIFGLVLLFHLVAISLILLQPGCQTRQPPPPPSGAEQTMSSPRTSAGSLNEQPRGDYTPPPDRQAPTRPVGSSRSTTGTTPDTSSTTGGTLDPAFNAGLTGDSAGGVLQPMLEPSVDLSSDGTTASTPSSTTTYTVVSGDNLTHIAREFGVTVQDIKAANGLSSSVIRVGQELSIPEPSAPVQNAGRDSAGETYTVQPGDALSTIASRHGTTVAQLKAANNLRSDRILVGQKLYVPEGSGNNGGSDRGDSPAANGGDSANTYTVKPGDTPSGIAQRFGITYQELMRVNNIASASRMQVGQRLIIPSGGRQPEASNTPTAPARSSQPSQERPAELRPQPSEPARIGGEPPPVEQPQNELDLLENGDLPLMDVEVIEGEEGTDGNP